MSVEVGKETAAREAAKLVRDGQVVGLGSGSTARAFARALAKRMSAEALEVYVIPTSLDAEIYARQLGLTVVSLNDYPEPDLAVDGADAVDPELNLIKGGGAALTREKIVDYSARKFVVIVDEKKLVESLLTVPIPVEVLPFAWRRVAMHLEDLGFDVELRTCRGGRLGPVITDNGNFILDAKATRVVDVSPEELEKSIDLIPGVVENGIFSRNKVSEVIVGLANGTVRRLQGIK